MQYKTYMQTEGHTHRTLDMTCAQTCIQKDIREIFEKELSWLAIKLTNLVNLLFLCTFHL